MTVHFFTGKDIDSATARYRGFLVVDELKKREVDVRLHEPLPLRSFFEISGVRFNELKETIRILFSVRRDDIIYLVRTVFRLDFVILVLFFRWVLGRKFVFDFDDTIYLKKFARIRSRLLTRSANWVVVGSRHLEAWAKKRNTRVTMVPTSVPFDIYSSFSRYSRSENNIFTIGWIGNGPNHVKNLRLIVEPLSQLVKKEIKFRFILIGALKHKPLYDLFEPITGLNIEIIDTLEWSDPNSGPKAIQGFDIGLMPLVEDEKTLGKCAFKAIEYMACAVPPIISPVGENNFLVREGQNGFFADNDSEWVEKIMRFYNDKNLRDVLGMRAQETIGDEYSYEASIPKLQAIFRELQKK